jgi:hypothetical protein
MAIGTMWFSRFFVLTFTVLFVGCLPKHVLEPSLETALEALSTATQQEQEGFKDAETRQQAVIALTRLAETMGNSIPLDKVCVSVHIPPVLCIYTTSQYHL